MQRLRRNGATGRPLRWRAGQRQSYTAPMNFTRLALLVAACITAPLAVAQWQWVDKDGRKVFSDQPPPASVPDRSILKRPGQRAVQPDPATSPAAAASAPASAVAKPSGRDKELEEKRKQAQAAEAEKRKAQEEEFARARAENCERAKKSKSLLDSGVRLVTTNSKGEHEFMDEAARAAEGKRLDGLIVRDCKPAGG